MNQQLLNEIETLRAAIKEDPRYQLFLKAEAALNSDEEVEKLSNIYHIAQNRYSEALQYYAAKSPAVEEAQKQLYLAKKNLDEHPVVQQYYTAYRPVRDMYFEIEDTLFSPFHLDLKGCREGK